MKGGIKPIIHTDDLVLLTNILKGTTPCQEVGYVYSIKDFLNIAPKSMVPLICDNPYHSFAVIANVFYPMNDTENIGIHLHPTPNV